MRAVRFDRYGGLEVLEVREVDDPVDRPGRAVVRVRAAAINPGENGIRSGALDAVFPATFPSGEGSDLAGVVVSVGEDVTQFASGDEVLGWSDERASHAELVSVPVDQLVAKPEGLAWEVAGSMCVAPGAGYAGVVTVDPQDGETIVVSAAAGGAGAVSAQLARLRGATVIGLAGEDNHDWLRAHDIVPVAYGEGQADRILAAAPQGVDGLIDTFGGGYLDLGVELGVPPDRMNSIADFAAAERIGASTVGTTQAMTLERFAELARLAAAGDLDINVAATYPLEDVRAAYERLADGHTRGKIVLIP